MIRPILFASLGWSNDINIDEINSRQDQILSELDHLERRIQEIIEIWTRTNDAEDQLENAA